MFTNLSTSDAILLAEKFGVQEQVSELINDMGYSVEDALSMFAIA